MLHSFLFLIENVPIKAYCKSFYFAPMFTGIIETLGTVTSIDSKESNTTFWISSPISKELKVDQSVSHSGICLTVEEIRDDTYRVTAIEETIKKTNISTWKQGTLINLERCMSMNGRLDGHIVQGHVDTTAICTSKIDNGGSWEYRFIFPEKFSSLIIEKGSISLNGISLTIFDIDAHMFSVAIIPYTYEHTNIQQIDEGSLVNLEFDMIGKYVNRLYSVPGTL